MFLKTYVAVLVVIGVIINTSFTDGQEQAGFAAVDALTPGFDSGLDSLDRDLSKRASWNGPGQKAGRGAKSYGRSSSKRGRSPVTITTAVETKPIPPTPKPLLTPKVEHDEPAERDLALEDSNKELVRVFYQKLFGDKDFSAIDEYISEEEYIQHNPAIADGREAARTALMAYHEGKPPVTMDIQRIAADGDLVYVHCKDPTGEEPWQFDAVMDIFRVKDGKITEHWDVIQPNGEHSENDHPFF